MTYLKVRWHHSFPNEPVILFSEPDANRWELRKVEADGSCSYAGGGEEFGGARLGVVATPPLEENAADTQFEPLETNEQEFEGVLEHRREDLVDS